MSSRVSIVAAWSASVVTLVGFAASASAALVAEETFSSGNGPNNNLNGANGGTGWGGAWGTGNTGASQAYANQVRNDVNVLSYPNYTAATTPAASGGNYFNLAAGFGTPNFNYGERFLDTSGGGTFGTAGYLTTNGASNTAIGADNTTLWGSFLFQAAPNGGANNGVQFWLRNPGIGDNTFSLNNNGGANSLLIFRISYVAGNDTISFWNNPDLATWTPSAATTGSATGDYQFNKLILVESQGDRESRFDDIRLGTQASDVVPVVPEPTTLAALGVGALGLLRRPR